MDIKLALLFILLGAMIAFSSIGYDDIARMRDQIARMRWFNSRLRRTKY